MKSIFYPYVLDLQLFGEGGAGAAGAGAAGGGVTPAQQGATGVNPAAAGQKGAKNPLADVKYGVQPSDAAEGEQTASAQTATTETDDKGEIDVAALKKQYKLYDDADVQNIVKSRLKSSKDTEARLGAMQPLMDALSVRYGTDDPARLAQLLESDATYFEDLAIKNGTTAEEERKRSADELKIRRIERERDELKRQIEEDRVRAEADRIYSGWVAESETLKQIYPSFDLQRELANQEFASLLRTPGISVRTAYEVIHRDEIIPGVMQVTADKTKEQIAKSIASNARRPVENGNSGQAAAITKSDVTQLTKADRAEIARRVARGEKITFGR